MNSSIGRISSAIIHRHRHRRALAWPRWTTVVLLALGLSATGVAAEAELVLPKKPAHIVVVIEENHGFDNIIGSIEAPYLNQLATAGAVFTQSYALAHPSQPNYLWLFAGDDCGVVSNGVPEKLPFIQPNLGAALRAHDMSFIGYSEGLPGAGSTVATAGNYARKHNPWVNWQGNGVNGLPVTCNLPLTIWPTNLDDLPTVAFVVPDAQNDMHDGSIRKADDWAAKHLGPYVDWAATHNSLLIVTFDEDDHHCNQRIPTFFVGPMVKPGAYDQKIDHRMVLRTITALCGLPPFGHAAEVQAIANCWKP